MPRIVAMDSSPTSPPAKNHYLLISLIVGAVPLVALGAILVFTPGDRADRPEAKKPAAAAAKDKRPEPAAKDDAGLPLFNKKPGVAKEQNYYDRKRQLVEDIWKEESRMEDRVRRVRDDPSTGEDTKLQLLGELAVRAGNAGLEQSREMLDAVYAMPAGRLRYSLINGVLGARVETDAEEALKLCGVLRETEEQAMARIFVVRHWALRDFDAATRAVEKLALPEERLLASRGLIEAAASRNKDLERVLARKDLSSDVAAPLVLVYAREWPGSLEDLKGAVASHTKPSVMAALMAGYGGNHPREALPYLQENPDQVIGEIPIQRIGDRLAGDDAHGALETVLEGPAFAERKQLVTSIFYGWMRRDLKGSGDWLRENEAKLGHAEQADTLKLKMAETMKNGGAKESARAWAEKISDEKVREGALREVEK